MVTKNAVFMRSVAFRKRLNNFKKKGGDNMITYSTLFEFCKLIVAIISLIFQIFNHKK